MLTQVLLLPTLWTKLSSPRVGPGECYVIPAFSWVSNHECPRPAGALLVASVFDPLFLLLPLLVAVGDVPVSLDSLLDGAATGSTQLVHALRCVRARAQAALEAVCEASTLESRGSHSVDATYRLCRARTIAVLVRKVRRLAEALSCRAAEASRQARLQQGATGAFSTISVAREAALPPPAEDAPTARPCPEPEARVSEAHVSAALSCVCEYLSDAWAPALTEASGCG